ncbi:metal cation symporter ZIP8-like [Brevipalpus obovatus]|uniref:metal cation symporter ZIP8-like n=1 Tax=Brevipalpus obovatus TaxID=246614 RepID=UPI003D9F35DB
MFQAKSSSTIIPLCGIRKLTRFLTVVIINIFELQTWSKRGSLVSAATSVTQWNRTRPILSNFKDASLLSAYVLIRGHIMFGPEDEAVDLDEDVLGKLLSHLYKVQQRHYSAAGPLVYPALKERDIGCDSLPINAEALCNAVMRRCLSVDDVLGMFPTQVKYFHQALARMCPLMVLRQKRYICMEDTEELEDTDESKRPIQLVEPTDDKVWAFGILFVTLSIVVSMGGLILLPFLARENRRTILTLFEGLAVGGLAGSAILHLFPQAFGISDDDYDEYFWRTFLIFAGIYIFYVTERILTLLNAVNGRGKKRGANFPEEDFPPLQLPNRRPLASQTPPPNTARYADSCETRETELLEAIFQRPTVHANSPKNQMDQKLATLRHPLTMKMITIQDMGCTASDIYSSDVGLDAETQSISRSKQVYVHDIAGMRKDQFTTTRDIVDAVAWMIVLGDASLNFIDGLSIGAAFDRNILAGISISVAVMLEEVPHRLGTFSVLIRAGMDMKQAFFWIFISACALYPGLALGAFLGDAAEEESPYIFAMAGGMFLYMALVDVMKEMNRSMENATRKGVRSSLQILALQNLGILIAVICLSILAIYEKEMDFEEVEIEEMKAQALP